MQVENAKKNEKKRCRETRGRKFEKNQGKNFRSSNKAKRTSHLKNQELMTIKSFLLKPKLIGISFFSFNSKKRLRVKYEI